MKTYIFLTHMEEKYDLRQVGVRSGEDGEEAYKKFIKECPEVLKKCINTIIAIEVVHKDVWAKADRFPI